MAEINDDLGAKDMRQAIRWPQEGQQDGTAESV